MELRFLNKQMLSKQAASTAQTIAALRYSGIIPMIFLTKTYEFNLEGNS